ncbi:magnesium transporter [Citricoccus sp. SGAir0253]|uniref:magnesium transporter n=1 Tax=Citricoccus sp. SGAir0253 TaxID=2567881 RepID=UPI0010CD3899|nr:magnesium transporter [Citricoccus sp. SGAir0253]QCU77966.1 magnesium transporter [Citricoccus sp. SGAir0253]
MDEKTMTSEEAVIEAVDRALGGKDLQELSTVVHQLSASQVIDVAERLNVKDRAVVFRLLPKGQALEVFEGLDATLQGELVQGLKDEEVALLFADLDPDDRVGLLDELPATVARRLLLGLPPEERDLTAEVLGYPQGSIGRRMSPEYVVTHPELTAGQSLDRIHERLEDAETIYTLPVLDGQRRVVGVVSLRDLMRAHPQEPVSALMHAPEYVQATVTAESAARRCADLRILALPVVDNEARLVGILTVDDALWILEDAESEDAARISGSEPLRRPYLATPVRNIVRSRIVWLLVLAIGATLTVQVLSVFEDTLEQMVVLTLFIPLLIGIGGNTGNQAATTVTRALALGDVRPRDIGQVLAREVRVGSSLGLLLGSVGFAIAALVYDVQIGGVIGLTLLSICTMAATVGGIMPLIGKAIRADPAVFSNPFITTFVDATGLIVYFLIARAILNI